MLVCRREGDEEGDKESEAGGEFAGFGSQEGNTKRQGNNS